MIQKQEVSKHCWKNGTKKLVWGRVALNLQFFQSTRPSAINWSMPALTKWWWFLLFFSFMITVRKHRQEQTNQFNWILEIWIGAYFDALQFSSVQLLSPVWLWDPMNRSMPGLPVHHQLPEFTQTHVHRVSDAIQTSHPLSSPSPPAPNPSQHQSLFQWINSSHEVAKGLEFSALASFLPKKSQGWSSEWTGWICLQSKGLSRVFSNTTVQKHQFFGPSSQSNSHIHTWPQEKP